MELSKKLYTQFIYKYTEIPDFRILDERISKAGVYNNVYMRDLSSLGEEELISEINAVMSAERSRYAGKNDSEYFLNLFKTNEKTYTAIFSVTENLLYHETDKCRKLCNILFETSPSEAKYWGIAKSETPESSLRFWENKFDGMDPKQFKGAGEGDGNIISESFEVELGVAQAFADSVEDGNDPLSICNVVLGNLISRVFSTDTVILNTALLGTPLSCAPFIYNREDNFKKSFAEVDAYMKEIKAHCFCTKEKLYKEIGNRFLYRAVATSCYYDENSYAGLLKKMRPDTLYNELSVDTLNTPVNVFFRFFNGKLNVSYVYDSVVVKKIDISKFHIALERIMKAFLGSSEPKVKEISAETVESTTDVEQRMELVKCTILRKLRAFEKYNEVEIKELASKFELVHKNAQTNILLAGCEADRVYFLCTGNVEALGINKNKFVNPLYLVKPGDVFGIDCILRNKMSKTLYRTMTSDAVLLSIGAADMSAEIDKHPEVLKELLEVQSGLLERFEKLWTMW
ncbi:MAG: cyclic nucleotide-binding domain-containing protein [Lachnospiraceae bacterium]|nr:cyclic nucleotide-binding domain-containing protein [Lachnospiraceae bacterium]